MAAGEGKVTFHVCVSSWRANTEVEVGAHDINLGRGKGSGECRERGGSRAGQGNLQPLIRSDACLRTEAGRASNCHADVTESQPTRGKLGTGELGTKVLALEVQLTGPEGQALMLLLSLSLAGGCLV